MPSKNDAWGIEVGANAIKALHLVRDGDELVVADYEVLPFKKILTTPDLNVDEAVQVGLDQLMTRYDMKKSTLVVSVPGHMAFARFAKLPPVEPKKIVEIVRFEAVQQIPFPLDQVEWDYQVFQQEDSPEVEVGIFAITKDRVVKFLSDYQHVGMRIDALTLSPLGVYNGLAYDLDLQEDSPGTILVDIGTSATDVIIVEGGGIWLRTLPIGGNNFTEALVKAFKLTFPKAEKLKREAGTSKYARQIFQAMRPVFADLVQEIQRSLGYYQSLNRDADLKRLIGVGSTFRLPGLTKFLKQQLQIDVKRLDGFKRLKIDGKREADFTSNALNMATVYGLALQGLEMERVSANILPKAIMHERMWKAKQPKFALAAGIVVAAVVGAQAALISQRSAFEQAMQANNGPIQAIINPAQQKVAQWKELESGQDPRNRLENFRRIPDYRDVWPRMLEDLAAAVTALNAQPALFGSDYDAIQQIPRAQRRRMYLDEYRVEYLPDGKTPRSAGGAVAARPPGGMMTDPYSDGGSDSESADPMPRYRVTLTGTTPNTNASAFIRDFINALQTEHAKHNRPYRIVEVQLVDLKPVPRATTQDARPGQTPIVPGGRPTGGRRGALITEPGMLPGTANPGYVGPAGRGRMNTGMGLGAYADLLPLNPLQEEAERATTNDNYFEVRYVIELLPPEEARLREDPAWQPPSPEPAEDDQLDGSEDNLELDEQTDEPGDVADDPDAAPADDQPTDPNLVPEASLTPRSAEDLS